MKKKFSSNTSPLKLVVDELTCLRKIFRETVRNYGQRLDAEIVQVREAVEEVSEGEEGVGFATTGCARYAHDPAWCAGENREGASQGPQKAGVAGRGSSRTFPELVMWNSSFGRRLLAEALGTFTLVFAGTTAIVVHEATGVVTHVGISLVFGLVVMSMIYAVGDISGAHLNPAVTFGFWFGKRISGRDALAYSGIQIVGAVFASLCVRVLFPSAEGLGATNPTDTASQAFLMEVLLTYFLMFTIYNVATGAKETGMMAGAAIGAVVALDAMIGGPVCGASMNPARSIGPALVEGRVQSLWIYIVAPVLGAVLATWTCRFLRSEN